MPDNGDAGAAHYASPPCFMHELDPAFHPGAGDPQEDRATLRGGARPGGSS